MDVWYSLVQDVHQDVERSLMDAGPSNGEADLAHCPTEGLLGQIRLSDCHSYNYLIWKKSIRLKFKDKVSLRRVKLNVKFKL